MNIELIQALHIKQSLETVIYLWEALGESENPKGHLTTLADIYRIAVENGIDAKELAKSSVLWQNYILEQNQTKTLADKEFYFENWNR